MGNPSQHHRIICNKLRNEFFDKLCVCYQFPAVFQTLAKIIIKEKYSGGGSDQREDEQFEFMQDRLV